jgi:hypothetical protein
MSDLGAPPPRPSTARLSMPPMAALEDLSRPRVLTVSFWCWLLGSLLAGATVALTATKSGAMRAEFARLASERDSEAPQSTIDSVASASVLIVIGAGITLALLGLLLAGAMRSGRGWARVFLTVIALLAVVYAGLVSSALTDPMLDSLRTPVTAGLLAYTALVIIATVCMFLPGASAWFRRPKGN